MIKELPQSKGSLLAFEIDGNITAEDEKKWESRLNEIIDKYEKVSVLIVLGKNLSWGSKAAYEEIKWIFKHVKKFGKLAFITDSKIWQWLIAVDSQFAKMMGIGERYFEPEKFDEALKWLSE